MSAGSMPFSAMSAASSTRWPKPVERFSESTTQTLPGSSSAASRALLQLTESSDENATCTMASQSSSQPFQAVR